MLFRALLSSYRPFGWCLSIHPMTASRCGLNSTTSNTQCFVLYGAVRQFPQGFVTGVAPRHLADAHVLPLRVPPPSVVHLCAAVGWVGAQNFFQAVGVARCVKEGRPHPDESDLHAVTKRLWGSTFGADLGCCSVLIGRMAGA